jgi:hypothetical protein
MTLHRHIVADRAIVQDGMLPLHLPLGWQIAEGNADDARVCGAHAWQSNSLVFADGYCYGTAQGYSDYVGAARRCGETSCKNSFCLTPQK